ncbi:calymmin isoform 2-T2 [Syngnathus typhle]
MGGRLVLQSVLILWLVQCVHTGGYAAGVSGVPNGHEAHFNGRGVGIPMGTQNGYPHKGHGGVAGMGHGGRTKGNGRGQGGWPQGYGSHAGATNHHPLKGNGYRAHAGAFASQGNKGHGYGGPAAGPQNGNKGQMKGYGPTTGALGGVQPNGYAHSGLASKGYGYGAKAGLPKRAGSNGPGGPERKPVKGYGQPYYGAGAGVGAAHGQGLPQPARNQANGMSISLSSSAYGTSGTLPIGGYTGGYGSAGMSLGRRYGSVGIKGPKPGYGGAAGGHNRQGAVPNGYGYPNGGTRYPVKPGYGNGVKPNGYGLNRGGYAPGVVPIGYGAKPTGYGAGAGGTKGYGPKPHGYGAGGFGPQGHKAVGPATPGQGLGGSAGIANQPAKPPNSGFGQIPYGKGPKIPGAPKGQGDALPPPEPTSGRLVMVTQDQYQKLPSPVPQGKNYIQPQVMPRHAPIFPQGKEPKFGPESSSGSAHMKPLDKGLKPYEAGPAGGRPVGYVFGGDLLTQKSPEAHDDAFGVGVDGEGYAAAGSKNVIHPQQKPRVDLKVEQVQRLETEEATDRRMVKENGGGLPISKGQGAKSGKPDCGPGGPNGQWMKIPRPAGAAGTNTKGYGAGAGVPNRFGIKPGYANNGYGGFGYPSAGQQPIYRPEANLGGAGYVKGNAYPGNAGPGEHSQAGYPNGEVAGVQPNYANLGHSVPTSDAKSGGGVQVPYNGPPAGVDGSNQPEPQPVGLGPNGKQGPVYGGMEGLPYGGQAGMGPEKANAKFGIGGLQFGGNPQTLNNGGGYGGIGHLLGLGNNGHMAGKYGYGRMPHDVQPVGFAPQLQSPGAGQYGPAGLPYQSGPLGFGPNVNYGGGDAFVGPQGHGGEGKPAGKHDNLAHHQGQPLQSASDGRSGSPYDSQPAPAENTNENMGYISGTKLQPEVISLPAAPSPLPLDSGFTPARADDLSSDLTGAGGLAFNPGAGRDPEQPDDPEQMPRQLHIQQQLKLHFHPQGPKNAKYDLNGFFGNSGY